MKVAVAGTGSRLTKRLGKAGFDVTAVGSIADMRFDPRTSHWTIGPVSAQVLVTALPVTGPNIITVPGNNFLATRYVIGCLRMMVREDARQIEPRRARAGYWRRPDPYDFILTPYESDIDDTHHGPAILTADGVTLDVEVHLMGHIQPIDGSYRWYGRITAHPGVTELHKSRHQDVTVRLPGGEDTAARLTELDPWGNTRVTGTGRPPFAHL
ncbi:MAG: DUF4873 domain-containing protein [Kibdelosporangium sp.]